MLHVHTKRASDAHQPLHSAQSDTTRHTVGAWLRRGIDAAGEVGEREGSEPWRHGAGTTGSSTTSVRQLVLKSLEHRWWIRDLHVADIRRSVAANVIASSSLEDVVALQHVGGGGGDLEGGDDTAEAPAGGENSSREVCVFGEGGGEGERGVVLRSRLVWIKFGGEADKIAFVEAVAHAKAQVVSEMHWKT